jgi:hypothetical protein
MESDLYQFNCAEFFWGQKFASWQPKKEVIMTNTKDFFGEKNGPMLLPDFEETCFEIIKFRRQVPSCGHQNMAGFLKYGYVPIVDNHY